MAGKSLLKGREKGKGFYSVIPVTAIRFFRVAGSFSL